MGDIHGHFKASENHRYADSGSQLVTIRGRGGGCGEHYGRMDMMEWTDLDLVE